MAEEHLREELCRSLGFRNLVDLHKAVQAGAKSGATPLLQKKLNAATLAKLGYTAPALAKLGFRADDLRLLGFDGAVIGGNATATSSTGKPDSKPGIGAPASLSAAPSGPASGDGNDPNAKPDIRALVNGGALAVDLKRRGLKAHHCKVLAGMSPRELFRIGYTLDDLLEAFSPVEVKAAGFNAREMNRFFSGPQLRGMGFTAFEMKVSGYSVRDLITFGFNENHIIGAGYSLNELVREGLNVRTVDRKKFQ